MAESYAEPISMASSVTEAVDAIVHAPETISTAFDMAEKILYSTIYATSFAVTFPVALLVAVIPKGTLVSQGIADGSAAAIDRANQMLRRI